MTAPPQRRQVSAATAKRTLVLKKKKNRLGHPKAVLFISKNMGAT